MESENIVTFEELIDKFDSFEATFNKNRDDSSMPDFSTNLAATMKDNRFNREQILQIRKKVEKMRKLFSNRVEELKLQNIDTMNDYKKVASYIKTAKL